MPDLDLIKQGEQEARNRRSLMFLVVWAMSVVLLGGVGGAAIGRNKTSVSRRLGTRSAFATVPTILSILSPH